MCNEAYAFSILDILSAGWTDVTIISFSQYPIAYRCTLKHLPLNSVRSDHIVTWKPQLENY